MATSENAKIQIETGQTLTAYGLMTDSGDHIIFTAGALWSGKSGYTPSVRPNGIVDGFNLLSAGATADLVHIAAFTAYVAGTLVTVAAATTSITRSSTASKGQVHSITMLSTGTIALVEGVLSASTTMVDTRAATGGPPLIAVTSVELGQVRVTTSTAAVITAAEIFQTVGTHTERYDYPGWAENNIGDGKNATVAAKKNSHVTFDSAIPLHHTGPAAKRVYIQYYTPVLTDMSKTMDFVPAETSHSVTSVQYYGGSIGSSSESLGQGSFKIIMTDGITDSFLAQKNHNITVKFFQDRNKTPYLLSQGKLGIIRSFPVADQTQADCTLSAEIESAEFSS